MSSPPPDDDDISDNEETMYPLARPLQRPLRHQPTPPVPSQQLPLQWSQRLKAYPLQNDPSDHILLPPTALEQLLSANPLNSDLPQPLTFRITNPQNNRSTHVGIREFSSEQETVGIPSWILTSLDLKPSDPVTITFKPLPKATRVKLRPLEAGYIEDDWKALLESQLRIHTTLTKGEKLSVRAGPSQVFEFLIDELEPEDAVNLIDTDVTTEIEEMSEDNARRTQKERIEAAKRRSTETVDVVVDKTVSGSVEKGGYVYYRLKDWDRSQNLEVVLSCEGDADLLVSTSEDWKPKVDMHLWSDMSGNATKTVTLASRNIELSNAKIILIGVHGYTEATFEITVRQGPETMQLDDIKPNAHAAGFTQCDNCLNWVPERSLVLHQTFCLRNNFRCPECNTVLPKKEQSSHWHCPDCHAHGNSTASFEKHRSIEHGTYTCSCSETFEALGSLAFHRATTCPQKLIKCRFCQTWKEQGDLSTLNAADMLAGLTPHEADCGSRTVECTICGRRLRIKELPVHQQLHDNERKTRPTPRNCRNINCVRPRADNPLGLCTICFGPLYSPLYDPGHRKLQGRLERKLLTQLMSGCGQVHCSNTPYCATAMKRTLTMSEAMKVVQAQVDGMLNESVEFHICVEEAIQRRAFLAQMIAAEGVYGLEWCRKAIEEAKGDLGKARNWLEQNGRRLDD